MKKLLLTITVLCFVQISAFSTGENWSVGGRSSGMANASVTLNDFWAIQQNQAGLTGVKNISAGIYYESRFGLKELSLKSGGIVVPVKYGVWGLSITSFGYILYNESKIGLAYARNFGSKFSMGLQLDYLGMHIAENYGNSSAIAGEVGLRYEVNKNFTIGAHIYNPTRAKVANYNDERASTIMKFGLGYIFSNKLMIAAETVKDIQYDPVFRFGIEYHPTKMFYFRTGIATKPIEDSFGFGIVYNNFNLDFATSYHQTLGFTPQVSLIFHANKSKIQPTIE